MNCIIIFLSTTIKIKWDIEKIKILHLLLNSIGKDNTDKILSFLEQMKYGWHNNEYVSPNICLFHAKEHCRNKSTIDENPFSGIYEAIQEIFCRAEYSKITLYIFTYCLIALFSSKLNENKIHLPFLLQIACNRNTTLYELIQEIVSICDVNEGIED